MKHSRKSVSKVAILLLCLLPASLALAQQSASYRLQESVLNNGGDPAGGLFASSSSYRIKLDALGEGVVGQALASGSYRMDSGFPGAYPPPAEVLGLGFVSKTSLSWYPEKSVGAYSLYRSLLSALPGSFGTCLQTNLTNPSTTDPATPPTGAGYFYLVTARNRLREEGTKGYRSSGSERPNVAPCP